MIVIVLLKIRHGKTVTLGNIEKAFSCGVKVIGLSLDMRDSKGAALINERRLAALVKNSPVPILVKGILTRKNALQAVEAGGKRLLLSYRRGRILEYLPSDVEVLKGIKDAVGENALIMVD